ncbi:hypothetical protein NLX86_07115 [Streptomyces sp. A3M-1-3]|uniref:hypothetical protein n=1 Tax=Streptomyces sp. A3M-1-3 TaxID=2962044 RepID=UPI0020B834E4|nr:hypothetical protein [Streptomyces sp. A3M-1-3]MCP3817912.1 hypothetical protein [Streptomyces sp. A3M-1-3]
MASATESAHIARTAISVSAATPSASVTTATLPTSAPAAADVSAADSAAHANALAAAKGGRLDPVIKLLKKSPDAFKSAVRAAKNGASAYHKWVKSLSWKNPLKYTLMALPGYLQTELINWLASQVG